MGLFFGAQATSRGWHGADFAESVIRRVAHDGNEPLTREECRKLFIGDASYSPSIVGRGRKGDRHRCQLRV